MINNEDVHNAAALIDAIDDAIGAAPSAMTTGQRSEQRRANSVRIACKRGIAELQHGSGNGFREPLGDRSPCRKLETDLVSLSRLSILTWGSGAPLVTLMDPATPGLMARH